MKIAFVFVLDCVVYVLVNDTAALVFKQDAVMKLNKKNVFHVSAIVGKQGVFLWEG